MWDLIKSDKTIRFWGICDILYFSWYLAYSIVKGKIPFYNDINQMIQTTKSLEHPLPLFIGIPALILYVSLPFSGKLLYQLNTIGAIVSYIQTPFRILFASPSLFFIYWPVSILYEEPAVSATIFCIALILLSETAKLITMIHWHINYNKKIITSASTRTRDRSPRASNA